MPNPWRIDIRASHTRVASALQLASINVGWILLANSWHVAHVVTSVEEWCHAVQAATTTFEVANSIVTRSTR